MKATAAISMRRTRIRILRLLLLGLLTAGTVPAAEAPASGTKKDYASFGVVTERNIFNASRAGGRTDVPRETRRPTRVDSFGLVGVMSYEKGPFAFFDGSGSEYRQVLQPGGTIAGFELIEILPNAVKLLAAAESNTTELRLGMQLHREEEGAWQLGERTEAFTSSRSGSSSSSSSFSRSSSGLATPSTSSSASTGSAGSSTADADEALQRLLKKRQEESQ